MPNVRLPTAGAGIIASAQVVRRFTITQAPGVNEASVVLTQLQCNNLPNVFIFIQQLSGLVGCSYEPRFAVDNLTVAGVSQPNWIALTPPGLVVLNIPAFVNFRIIANMIALNITTPAGAGNSVFTIVVGASQ